MRLYLEEPRGLLLLLLRVKMEWNRSKPVFLISWVHFYAVWLPMANTPGPLRLGVAPPSPKQIAIYLSEDDLSSDLGWGLSHLGYDHGCGWGSEHEYDLDRNLAYDIGSDRSSHILTVTLVITLALSMTLVVAEAQNVAVTLAVTLDMTLVVILAVTLAMTSAVTLWPLLRPWLLPWLWH